MLEGLLRNAAETTPDGGRIEVSVAESANDFRVEVRDYGMGITAENQKNIFGGSSFTVDFKSVSQVAA